MDKAAVALFALLNGDDVHATFIELYSHYPYPTFSHLYLFCFVILFITAILNIFIFIIEDAYRAAKDYINAEAERHSRQFKANESGDSQLLGIQEFDLPTLFDILDDVSSSMSQERAHKLMERTLKKNIIACVLFSLNMLKANHTYVLIIIIVVLLWEFHPTLVT
jgi:hypothetical protein